jgi:hypothetical protein
VTETPALVALVIAVIVRPVDVDDLDFHEVVLFEVGRI